MCNSEIGTQEIDIEFPSPGDFSSRLSRLWLLKLATLSHSVARLIPQLIDCQSLIGFCSEWRGGRNEWRFLCTGVGRSMVGEPRSFEAFDGV